jgi:phosphatidylserine/phosphatidylglycerophosphate/cardiolipin synthase-like enzyme
LGPDSLNGGSTTIWLSGKLHHKFTVVDNRTVNDEKLLVIESPLLAAHFTREVDRLWRSADLGVTDALRRQLDQNRSRYGSGVERL